MVDETKEHPYQRRLIPGTAQYTYDERPKPQGYSVPDELPRSDAEAKQAAEHNRIWCKAHHQWRWQEKKHNGLWSFWCPTCFEWRA